MDHYRGCLGQTQSYVVCCLIMLIFVLLLQSSEVVAQPLPPLELPTIKKRVRNVGLVVGYLYDQSGHPVSGATVNLTQVRADDSCSDGTIRIYGPNNIPSRAVPSDPIGTFAIAFEWEPEQLGCVTLAPVKAGLKIIAYDDRNDYRVTELWVPLTLIPNVQKLYKGAKTKFGANIPQFEGELGKLVNKAIEQFIEFYPPLKVYMQLLSRDMSVETYMLAGSNDRITVSKP